MPASCAHTPPDTADWNQVTPVVFGTPAGCLLPLTFSCSPCSRCCCYSFGLNSTGSMYFLDIINLPVTRPQCSYQLPALVKQQACFARQAGGGPLFCLNNSYTEHEQSSLPMKTMCSRRKFFTRFQGNREVPAQVLYLQQRQADSPKGRFTKPRQER